MKKSKRITKFTVQRAFRLAQKHMQSFSECLDGDPDLRENIGTIVVMAYLPPRYRTKKNPILGTLHGRCGYGEKRMRQEAMECCKYLLAELFKGNT